jgi:hypothetical protein
MRTIGNKVDDGRLRRGSGQWRRSGIDGCRPGCCTLVLHRFRVLRTNEPSLVRYDPRLRYRFCAYSVFLCESELVAREVFPLTVSIEHRRSSEHRGRIEIKPGHMSALRHYVNACQIPS